MNYTESTKIKKLTLHKVGNKSVDEKLILSDNYLEIDEYTRNLLMQYFLSSFNSEEYFSLYHDVNLNLNEVFVYSEKVFANKECLYKQSINFAKHLYEQSKHPKIKGGEFYVVYFDNCFIQGNVVDAIGLFKSENKDTFLKVFPIKEGWGLEYDKGININKLDKGCLIFNIDKENGYVVAVVDNTGKGSDAQYWIEDFLHVRPRKDEYYNTQNVLSLTKNFIVKALPEQFEVSKADQIELLNKSVQFFKEKENFSIEEFTDEVIAQPELVETFTKYKEEYQKKHEVEIADNFTISESAVKKQSRAFKSVIKLDKNFHIYVHGNNQYIKRGYDEKTGMYYYQLFFKEEE